MDTLIKCLKQDTIWSVLDFLYPYALAKDTGQSHINWVNPGSYRAIKNGTTTFTADQGWQSDGTSGYHSTQWISSSNGVNFTLNSASFGCYIRTNSDNTAVTGGSTSASNTGMYMQVRSSNLFYGILNHNTSVVNISNSDSRGMFAINRSASDSISLIKNGTATKKASVSGGLSTRVVTLEAYNLNGTMRYWNSRQFSLQFGGGSMSNFRHSVFNTDFERVMDRMGTGVE